MLFDWQITHSTVPNSISHFLSYQKELCCSFPVSTGNYWPCPKTRKIKREGEREILQLLISKTLFALQVISTDVIRTNWSFITRVIALSCPPFPTWSSCLYLPHLIFPFLFSLYSFFKQFYNCLFTTDLIV